MRTLWFTSHPAHLCLFQMTEQNISLVSVLIPTSASFWFPPLVQCAKSVSLHPPLFPRRAFKGDKLALQQGVNGCETHRDENPAEHVLQGSGRLACRLPRWLLGESTAPGEQHSRASSLPAVKLKRGQSKKIKGEREVKRRQKGAFRAPFMQLTSRSTSQGS